MKQSRWWNISLLKYFLTAILISVVSGTYVFLTQGEWWPADFWTIQIYSNCIVFSVLACHFVLRMLVPQIKLSFALRMAILAPALVLGYEVGSAIAAYLSGHPVVSGAFMRMSKVEQLIIVTSIVSAIYLFWSHRRIAEEKTARAEAMRLAAEVQLRLLQSQLEPHMLFNTLANLHSLIEVDAERSQLMVEHLIELMQRTLSASRKETVALRDEFALIEAYLKLMAIRMGPRLSFNLILPDSLAHVRLPAMLLQPLVENAIKHGLEPKIEGGTIEIKAVECGKWLQVSICDTGTGLSESMNEECYGITHVQERLRVLYGDEAIFSLQGMPAGGVMSMIRMPL